jgi:hypothetical protein
MGQLQKEMLGRQLAEYAKEMSALQAIVSDSLCDRGGPGAFIQAKEIAFFVSAGLGRQELDGIKILFVSPMAPLARSMQNKKAGDGILFNGVNSFGDNSFLLLLMLLILIFFKQIYPIS